MYLTVVTVFIMVFISACSDVEFSSDESSLGQAQSQSNSLGASSNDLEDDSFSDEEVATLCETSPHLSLNQSVLFESPQGTCDFGQGENLDRRNGYHQAYRMQKVNLALPIEALICDVSFSFKDQQFRFDDSFILTLNENILVSSTNYTNQLSIKNEFFQFDWSKIRGTSGHDVIREDYCVGKLTDEGSCSFPAQEEYGIISLSIDNRLIQKASTNSQKTQLAFQLITTGDDNDSDCQHLGMEFEATYKYVRP